MTTGNTPERDEEMQHSARHTHTARREPGAHTTDVTGGTRVTGSAKNSTRQSYTSPLLIQSAQRPTLGIQVCTTKKKMKFFSRASLISFSY